MIFEEVLKFNPDLRISPITRGSKLLELKIGPTIFRDSLLHLPGSLKSLAKSFELQVQKGYFPHLFNQEQHFNYTGPIPEKRYFDLTWTVKNDKELQEFNDWYTLQQGEWNFKDELLKYCIDDVEILSQIVFQFHNICFNKFKISPWFSTTGPSYVHKVIIASISSDEYLNLPPINHKHDRMFRIQQLARHEHWAVLESNEYFFARQALRGGRTDVRCVMRELTEDEKARGCRIVYQDMVSMYPAVQLKYRYPVGTPTIHVYDDQYYPCDRHRNPKRGNVHPLVCQCPLILKKSAQKGKLFIAQHAQQPNPDFYDDEDFFGFICVTIQPPSNLYHPCLVSWDEVKGKCVATLETLHAQVFTTPEFKMALSFGYKVLVVHRIDIYKWQPGLWNNFIKNLYIEKMANSEPPPNTEKQQELVDEYEKQFQMGEAVKNSFPRWKKDPALRLVFKIMLNSGWGKHCQRPNMPKTTMIRSSDTQGLYTYFENVQEQKFEITGMNYIGDWTLLKSNVCGSTTNPDFHGTYLPAGVMVPSYGRMELYFHLSNLGKRVLYHDTDSIIYIYDPQLVNIPTSDILGSWSEEDISKDNIVKFIGIGPKSYGIKTDKGDVVKVKGISLRRCTTELLNFTQMEQLINAHLRNEYPTLEIPQMNFQYNFGAGMTTAYNLKKFSFQPEDMKGILHSDLHIYPPGYCENCKNNNCLDHVNT